MAKGKDLTEKQRKYVENRLKGLSRADAYIDAYSTNGNRSTAAKEGKKLEANPKIADLLEVVLTNVETELTEVATATAEWCINMLQKNAQLAQMKGEFGAANKAIELLGKTRNIRLFEDQSGSDVGKSDDGLQHDRTADGSVPLSSFDEFLAEATRVTAESASEETLPN